MIDGKRHARVYIYNPIALHHVMVFMIVWPMVRNRAFASKGQTKARDRVRRALKGSHNDPTQSPSTFPSSHPPLHSSFTLITTFNTTTHYDYNVWKS